MALKDWKKIKENEWVSKDKISPGFSRKKLIIDKLGNNSWNVVFVNHVTGSVVYRTVTSRNTALKKIIKYMKTN